MPWTEFTQEQHPDRVAVEIMYKVLKRWQWSGDDTLFVLLWDDETIGIYRDNSMPVEDLDPRALVELGLKISQGRDET